MIIIFRVFIFRESVTGHGFIYFEMGLIKSENYAGQGDGLLIPNELQKVVEIWLNLA